MSNDDLDLEPMNRGGGKRVVIGVVLLAAAIGGAVFVNSRLSGGKRTEQLARASGAWNELQRCLVGDAMPANERVSTRVRHIEIARPASERAAPPDVRRRHWPYRCATHASVLTHALFESGSTEGKHRLLAMLASRAATGLENGELRTGRQDNLAYLDELFEAARRADLPQGAAATAPPPPEPADPLTPRRMTAMLAGAESAGVLGADPVASRTLRVVMGRTARKLCVLAGDGPEVRALTTARCTSLAAAAPPADVSLVSATDDARPFVRVRYTPSETNLFAVDEGDATQWALGGNGGYATGASIATVRPRAGSPGWDVQWLSGPNTVARTVAITPGFAAGETAVGPTVLWDHVAALGPATPNARGAPPAAASTATPGGDAGAARPAGDGGTGSSADAGARGDAGVSATPVSTAPLSLYVAQLPADGAAAPQLTEVGRVPAPAQGASITGCRTGQALAFVVRGADDRVAVAFRENDAWAAPVWTEAPPRANVTCRGNVVSLTWTETATVRNVQQARCTPAGCLHVRAPLPDSEGEPVVVELEGRVLFLTSPRGLGLRMRLAPIAELHRADEVVLIDDADHGGLNLSPITHAFVRGPHAVVFVTSTGVAEETYGVRISADGTFTSVRPIETRGAGGRTTGTRPSRP